MFNIKKVILTLVLILSAVHCRAASEGTLIAGNFSVSSGAVYGGQNYSYGYNIAVDSKTAGGPFIYVRGQSGMDNLILKYSSAGFFITSVVLPAYYNTAWVNYDYNPALAVDNSGNVYTAGTYDDILLMLKYDTTLDPATLSSYTYTSAPGPVDIHYNNGRGQIHSRKYIFFRENIRGRGAV